MDIIVWIEDNATGEVLQSEFAAFTTSNVDEMDNIARYIGVYPNPANDIAGIEIDLLDRSDVSMTVVNAMGQTVFADAQTLDAGIQKVRKTLRLNVAH